MSKKLPPCVLPDVNRHIQLGTSRKVFFDLPLTRAPSGSGESHILLGGVGSPVISQTAEPLFKIQTPFDSHAHELSKHDLKFDLEVNDDVACQVKVDLLNFRVL